MTRRLPSETETIAMAIEWASLDPYEEGIPDDFAKHWRELHGGRKAMWRKDARAFLNAVKPAKKKVRR